MCEFESPAADRENAGLRERSPVLNERRVDEIPLRVVARGFVCSPRVCSFRQTPMDHSGDLITKEIGFRVLLCVKRSRIEPAVACVLHERSAIDQLLGKQSRQFLLERVCNRVTIVRIETVQYELFNVQSDRRSLHHQPPISASVKGFSSFAYSLRA